MNMIKVEWGKKKSAKLKSAKSKLCKIISSFNIKSTYDPFAIFKVK